MSQAALSFVDPGPFDQIVGFGMTAVTYRLRVIRDDGLIFNPESAGMTITLFDENWNYLFEGFSWPEPGTQADFTYWEATPGLIVSYGYRDEYYTITFNMGVVWELLQRGRNDFVVYIMIDGAKTLETYFPRSYTSSTEPFAISVGNYDIYIPYWEKVTTNTYPNLGTTNRTTTLYSSVPYSARYRISYANSYGRFVFPILAVVWTPNSYMTGWQYDLRIIVNCPNIQFYIPPQSIAGLTPPQYPPSSPSDQVDSFYVDLVLTIAVDACSNIWNETTIDVTTEFGYSGTIPFSGTNSTMFSATYYLPDVRPASLLGDAYSRTLQFIWDRTTIPYDTGIWPTFYQGQLATMTQSPQITDSLTFYPEPE